MGILVLIGARRHPFVFPLAGSKHRNRLFGDAVAAAINRRRPRRMCVKTYNGGYQMSISERQKSKYRARVRGIRGDVPFGPTGGGRNGN